MDALAERTGRALPVVEYFGHPEAERVIVLMGSGARDGARDRRVPGAARRAGRRAAGAAVPAVPGRGAAGRAAATRARGSPCSTGPRSRARSASRCSSTWSPRSPRRTRTASGAMPRVIGGRYGLSSKEFTPGMVAGGLRRAGRERPRRRFTVGINDDVTGTSLPYDPTLDIEPPDDAARGLLRPRLGRHGRREQEHRSRSSARTQGCTPRATSSTTRRSPARRPSRTCASARSRSARRTWCQQASFVGCHHFGLLDRVDVLRRAAPGATLLLNSAATGPDEVWDELPRPVQQQIVAKRIAAVRHRRRRVSPARPGCAGGPTPCCRPASSRSRGCCRATRRSRGSRRRSAKTYGRRGDEVVERNHAAVDATLAALHRDRGAGGGDRRPRAPAAGAGRRAGVRPHGDRRDDGRPRRRAAGQRAAGRRHLSERHRGVREAQHRRPGRRLGPGPVHPVRQLQLRLPAQRDPGEVLRRSPSWTARPDGFRSVPLNAVGLPDTRYTLQVYVEDCTGCGLCVEACPARRRPTRPQGDQPRAARAARRRRRENIAFFETLPVNDRSRVDFGTVRGTQFLAAAVRVLRRLRRMRRDAVPQAAVPAVRRPADDRQRHRLLLDLRRQPADHAVDAPTRDGRGPAWSNSLFEDNAEFGLGLPAGRRPAHRAWPGTARRELRGELGAELVDAILDGAAATRVRARAPSANGWPSCKSRGSNGRDPAARSHDLRSVVGPPGAAQRVDRRRRRLGLRHRLRRARPRPGHRARRQRAGARHRGLLQHRRPGVEGDAARRVANSPRPARPAEEGPGPAGDRLRQRLRRAGRHGRRPAADAARLPRGRGLRRARR